MEGDGDGSKNQSPGNSKLCAGHHVKGANGYAHQGQDQGQREHQSTAEPLRIGMKPFQVEQTKEQHHEPEAREGGKPKEGVVLLP